MGCPLPHGAPELRLAFSFGPAARRDWAWVTPGSLAGAVAFLIFSYLFRLYVPYLGGYDKAYGPLGGIMVLLFGYWAVGLVLLGAAGMDRAIEDQCFRNSRNGA